MARLRTGAERRDTPARVGAGAAPARRAGNASRAVRAAPRRARRGGGPFGGRYRLLDWVDSGGMAAVYRARDERLRREVAIKVIAEHLARHPWFVARFRREAQVGRQLAHPNIVATLDAGEEPRYFIAMEFVDGLDASRLIRQRGRLTARQAVHVLAQICEALAYLHAEGVVHCDISPANFLLRRADGTAKLADFGLAARRGEAPALPTEIVTGTPGYVAPELLQGALPTPRSDLYSLGVAAYRLLAGPKRARPRDAQSTAPMATGTPRMPPLGKLCPDLPRGLTDAVQRAMASDPARRQRSVLEFGAALAA
jgi:eukaryotic-like serine/threonine-protein kinase